MKKLILFAFAASLVFASASAATKATKTATKETKKATAEKLNVTNSKLTGDEKKGYEAGYSASLVGKSNPFEMKIPGSLAYQKGYKAGLAQHAFDEGMKVGATIDARFDSSKIPPYNNSKQACENWIKGYKSMYTIALAGWKAGYDAYEKSGDACTVPSAYAKNAELYRKHYKKAHDNAVQVYQYYISEYKRGYATEGEILRDDIPSRPMGEDDSPDTRTWFQKMFDDLSDEVYYGFKTPKDAFSRKFSDGFMDGHNDKIAGKAARY